MLANPDECCPSMETQEERTELCRKRAMMGTLVWRGRQHNKDSSEDYGK